MHRWLLVLFALCLLAVCVSLPTKADPAANRADPEPPRKAMEAPPVDPSLKPLRAALIEAIGADFILTGLRVAYYDDYPLALATLRAKKAGAYVFEAEFVSNGKVVLEKGWKEVYTCHLTIGEAGRARAVWPHHHAWPLACVGDEVVIPLHFDQTQGEYRYALRRDEITLEQTARRDAEWYEDAWVARGRPPAFDLRNGAAEHLELIATTATSYGHRGLNGWGHYLNAVFEARKPGRFGLSTKLIPAPDRANLDRCTVETFPRGQPIRVMVTRFSVERHWDRPFGTSMLFSNPRVVMRVGDRLLIGCAEYHTVGAERPEKYLAVEALVVGADPETFSDAPRRK